MHIPATGTSLPISRSWLKKTALKAIQTARASHHPVILSEIPVLRDAKNRIESKDLHFLTSV